MVSCVILTACSSKVAVTVPKTEVVYLTPEKINRPPAPNLTYFNSSKGMDEKSNFKHLQINMLKLRDYCRDLLDTIEYYESSIDGLKKK